MVTGSTNGTQRICAAGRFELLDPAPEVQGADGLTVATPRIPPLPPTKEP